MKTSRNVLVASLFLAFALSSGAAPLEGAESGAAFIRGDSNADGLTDLSDAIDILWCAFEGLDCPDCRDASDIDDDGAADLTDVVSLLTYLYLGGAAPPAPFDACGVDPTDDALGCASFGPCSDPDGVPTDQGTIHVTPINHASLVLQWDGKTIIVDPVGGASRFTGFGTPDLILVTDIHTDHMDAATLKAIVSATGTVLVIPKAVSQSLGVQVNAAETKVLDNGQTATVLGDAQLLAVPMYNTTADRLQYHTKGRGNGYVLDLAGTRVYLSGDTEDIPEMRALEDIGLAFLCMNLPYTMTPQQAASATLEFKPRVVYPYHYRGQSTETFRSLVQATEPGIDVRLRNWYE